MAYLTKPAVFLESVFSNKCLVWFSTLLLLRNSISAISAFVFSPASKHKLDLSRQPSGEYFVIVESVDSEKIALPILLED